MENEDRDVRLHRVIYEAVKFFSGCNDAQTAICSDGTKVSNVIKAIYCFKGRDDKIKIIPHLKAFIAAIKKLFPEENALRLVGPDLEKHEIYEIYMFFGEILQYYSELKLAVEFHKLNAQMWRGEKDDYFRLIRIYEHLGSLYHDLGELEKAKESYKGVLELCKTFMGEMSFDVASAYMNLGLVYQCEGRNEEANVNFERVLEIVIGILNHGDLASFYNALGAGYLKTNQVEDAKTCHEQALQIQQKNFGSDHSEISFNCNRIALMYGANGELELENDWNQRAVKIREGQVGPTNVHVAYPCSNREIMHDENGQMDSVTNCHQQGQEIGADNQFGRKHVDLANSPTLRVCELIGEQKLPKNCLQQALENIEKQLGPCHVGVATAFYHLGTVYKNMGELDRAKDFHQRALGIREKKTGSKPC
jgi:tetratricopeptide (TPR) repeat protein